MLQYIRHHPEIQVQSNVCRLMLHRLTISFFVMILYHFERDKSINTGSEYLIFAFIRFASKGFGCLFPILQLLRFFFALPTIVCAQCFVSQGCYLRASAFRRIRRRQPQDCVHPLIRFPFTTVVSFPQSHRHSHTSEPHFSSPVGRSARSFPKR